MCRYGVGEMGTRSGLERGTTDVLKESYSDETIQVGSGHPAFPEGCIQLQFVYL